jgi:hypothetical protein
VKHLEDYQGVFFYNIIVENKDNIMFLNYLNIVVRCDDFFSFYEFSEGDVKLGIVERYSRAHEDYLYFTLIGGVHIWILFLI